MDKQFYFISGMPRAGSTLMASILNQHPEIHAFTKSGLIETMVGVRNNWYHTEEHAVMDVSLSRQKLVGTLSSVMDGYYRDTISPIVVDDSRAWLGHIELLEALVPDIKIVVPVRDIRNILASFERLWRKASANRQIAQEKNNYAQMQSVSGRCGVWMRHDQPVGIAYSRIKDALVRGHGEKLFFMNYDALVSEPRRAMGSVSKWLGIEPHEYDFSRVATAARENEAAGLIYGFDGLHETSPAVRPSPTQWREVIGEVGDDYAELNTLFGIRSGDKFTLA